jgi:Flp pilus assembly protein TadG
MMFALASPVLMMGAGVAVDYSLFAREKARLAMIADEASLAAVSNSSMYQSTGTAWQTAQNIFATQASQVPQVTVGNNGYPTGGVTTNNATLTRTATVSYSASYNTIFANILGVNKLSFNGTSVATAQASANINFTVLLDNQGSMALPDSASGISTMQSLTPQQNPGGCAFACHEAAPNNPLPPFGADTAGNPCVTGTSGRNCPQIDNYTLARNNGIRLRFDDVQQAISDLMTTATNLQSNANPVPTYQMSVYSVDSPYTQGLYSVMPQTSNYASTWATDAPNLQLYTVYSDGAACVASGGAPCGAGVSTATSGWGGQLSYQNVGFFSSPMGTEMSKLATTIPKGGTGANGDVAEEVLLVVTDGVEDTVNGSSLSIGTWDATAQAACTTMKNNGVKIAILYTTYYPTPGFWLYNDYVEPVQSQIGSVLQTCASPGLYMQASSDSAISQDLQTLFLIASASPKLTQ